MSQASSLLKLHLSQAELALNRVSNNSYSDKRKQEYQRLLFALFEAISLKIENEKPSDESIIFATYKSHLDFIFKSIEFLDSSTLNRIPYEIVECLDIALKDWTNSQDNFIIVTSLINNVSAFSFDPSLVYNNAIYEDILKTYNIDFATKLVQINVPKSLSRDYLSSVVLYHELGHFIDVINNICDSITLTILSKINNNLFNEEEKSELVQYFPYIKESLYNHVFLNKNSQAGNALLNHIAEYYCDLFASQYIGEASNYYLYYLTESSDVFGLSHPSTTNRIKVVSDFLNQTPNIIVEIVGDALYKITSKKLEKRFDALGGEDFLKLVPVVISNDRELHGVYSALWFTWLNKFEEINHAIANKTASPLKAYKVLNNLTEKSIGNYIIQKKWRPKVGVK